MKKLLVLSLAIMSSVALADMNVDMKIVVDGKEANNQCAFDAAAQVWNLQYGDLVFTAAAKPKNDTHAEVELKVFRKDDKGQSVAVAQGQLELIFGKPDDLACRAKETPESEEKEIFKLRITATK